jgi:hypothetical protein
MTNLMERGQAWLSMQLKDHASKKIIYRREATEAELSATIGKSEYDQDDGEGIVTRSQVRDFLINTSDLLESAIGSLPRRGDSIVEVVGTKVFEFEVMSLGNEPPWRYSDPFRFKLRIHTKQVGVRPET